MTRTIIKGGTIVSAEREQRADLLIDGEKVAGIVANAQPQAEDRVIDATDLLVLPGIVDAHTHIQLDTGIYKTADNWEIDTKAAAAGGVTTVIDFATQFPGQTVDQALDNRLQETAPAVIDYGLHCMITDLPHGKEEAMLGRLMERGVPSFKVYTTYRPNYYMDDATLLRLMRAVHEVDGLVMVHAENDAIVTEATRRLISEGRTGWEFHGQGRPIIAEEEAVNRVVFLAVEAASPLYVVHCTSVNSLTIIERGRGLFDHLYCETCPQYLLLDERCYQSEHPEFYILQPPLRYRYDQSESMHRGELLGSMDVIDVISTDSCDYTLAQKTEHHDFTRTPGGLPGLETLLPLMFTYLVQIDDPILTLTDMIRKLCLNPARLFGLYPRKGALMVGSDADVVLYDPAPEGKISHKNLHYMAGYSPYEGMRVKGKVRMTLSRGEVVYQDGEFPTSPGRGRFVPGLPFSKAMTA